MIIKGKTILLTGASGGIGQAIARRLNAEGARLIVSGRNTDKLRLLCTDLGRDCLTLGADISTDEGRQAIAHCVESEKVDIVIHNAGAMDFDLFANQDSATLQAMIQLNLMAPALLTQALLPSLIQRPEAAIVFIGSTFGSIGHPGFAMYCASKFGLRGFAESLRRELSDTAIKVDYLAPRATRTELNSASVVALNESIGNAMDDPEVVADELVRLLGQTRGSNRYIGWPEKFFVRINSLLPGIVDSALNKKLAVIRSFALKE